MINIVMKSTMKKFRLTMQTKISINALLLAALFLSFVACKTQGNGIVDYTVAIQKYIEYDAIPNSEKPQFQNTLDTIVNSLKTEIEQNKDNYNALYYYGFALGDKLNGGDNLLNFSNISLENTQRISQIFSKLTKAKDFHPDYKYSQYSKLTQIWGNLAVNYVIKGVPDSADYAFLEGKREGGFPDANLEYCRNVLNSLEPNAILFVSSSIELYNYMFIQCEENIRIDVSLVSANLLGFYWYAKWINFLPNLTQPTNTNCSDSFLDMLFKGDSLRYDGSQNFRIDNFVAKIKVNGFNSNGYLSAAQSVMLEIIKFNAAKRSIYFSQPIASLYPGLLGLNQNIISEGLVFKVVPDGKELVNNDKLLKNLLESYKYKNASKRDDRDFAFIIEEYKTAFMQAIMYNTKRQADKSKVQSLLDKFEEVFPASNNPRSKDEEGVISEAKAFLAGN